MKAAGVLFFEKPARFLKSFKNDFFFPLVSQDLNFKKKTDRHFDVV